MAKNSERRERELAVLTARRLSLALSFRATVVDVLWRLARFVLVNELLDDPSAIK